MIGLDTNVIVRVLVGDDARQSALARGLIERAMADRVTLFVPGIVVCETVWVLESVYGLPREIVAEAIAWMLAADQLTIENREETQRALASYADGRGDLADFLLLERALRHGAGAVATFDRALLRSPGFVDPDTGTWTDDVSLREAPPRYRPAGRLVRPRT